MPVTENQPKEEVLGWISVLQGAPRVGDNFTSTFPSAPDPLFKAFKVPFLTSRVATPSGAPRQAPLESGQKHRSGLPNPGETITDTSHRRPGENLDLKDFGQIFRA